MAKRSARIDEEASERSELKCMWSGLFRILSLRQLHVGPYKLISSRRPTKTNITDNSRKVEDQLPKFDEECQRIQNEQSVRNLIQDDIYNDRGKNKQARVKPQQLAKPDSKLTNYPVKTHEATRKKSERANQSFTTKAPSSIHHHQLMTSPHADDETLQEAKMSIKAFIDQMFVDGKLVRRTESMPLSDALQVLRTNKRDLFMDVLQEPDPHYLTKKRSHQKSNGKAVTFSVREMKQKLKHFGDFRKESNQFSTKKISKFGYNDRNFRVVNSSINAKTKEKMLKSDRGFDIACLNETTRKKIDFSSSRSLKKHDFDVALEAKRRRVFARLRSLNAIGSQTSKRSPGTVRMISSSTEELLFVSPRRDDQFCPYGNFLSPNERERTSKEVISCDDYEVYDDTTDCLSAETNYEAHDIDISETGEPCIVETKNICHANGTVIHYTSDALSENKTFTSAHDLNMSESIKYQEEHQSPVSVLELFFTEDANSNYPSNIMHQTDRKRSQPRCLYFDKCPIESSHQDQTIIENTCSDEQNYISKYVHLVLQASNLNWDQLSKINPQYEELIPSSAFDEVEFLPPGYHSDPKLLFDHMNEVLLKIHRSHFYVFPCQANVKSKTSRVPLENLVLDEIMRKGAQFDLSKRIEELTVDQLVANDVSDSGSWIDARTEAERIMNHISEGILEDFILDSVLGFHS